MAINTRIRSMDEKGKRIFFHPLEVTGKWRVRRDIVYSVLILIFLSIPWIRIAGDPIFLFDIVGRRFFLFTHVFYSHDAPFLFFFLSSFVLVLFLATALWGRIWCGWACPQTVFIEGLFRRIEGLVEGKAAQRRWLEKNDWTLGIVLRKILKHLIFLTVTLVITHSFLGYFVSMPELIPMISKNPKENWTSFLFIMVSTSILYFNFSYFREQFCIIVCPYGRFQSALLDRQSKIIAYDSTRNDCVQCRRCIEVCPTGIDIRNGLQMECLSCTACIDACDEIMKKVNKPLGLIRYVSLRELAGQVHSWMRPRIYIYVLVLSILASGALIAAAKRKSFDVSLMRRVPIQDSEGKQTDQLLFEVKNSESSRKLITFKVLQNGFDLVNPEDPMVVKPGEVRRISLFLNGAIKASPEIDIEVLQKETGEVYKKIRILENEP